MNENDIEWLAGLVDAEGCFHSGLIKTRRGNVISTFQIGLVRCDVMESAHRFVQELVGEQIPALHVRPATKTQREFYSLTVTAKHQVQRLVEALHARLHGKRAEALVSRDILNRSVGRRYSASDRDRELCEMSSRVKKGDAVARSRILSELDTRQNEISPSNAWLAGMLDGDGGVYILRESRGSAHYYYMRANISSSDETSLHELREAVARSYSVTALSKQEARGGSRPSYGFNIGVDDIERFLSALRPHLRVKATEADVMISVCRGETTREEAYPVLRAMKVSDDPKSLQGSTTGLAAEIKPQRLSRMGQYRRPTYDQMKEGGLWSSEEARKHLGGCGHAAWMTVIEGLSPQQTIGNKKYFDPLRLKEHVMSRLGKVVRSDARERMRQAMETWSVPPS